MCIHKMLKNAPTQSIKTKTKKLTNPSKKNKFKWIKPSKRVMINKKYSTISPQKSQTNHIKNRPQNDT